jgi:hypothetical protein
MFIIVAWKKRSRRMSFPPLRRFIYGGMDNGRKHIDVVESPSAINQ